MNKGQMLLLLVALIFITAIITAMIFQSKDVVAVQTVPMDVKVGDSYAFNLDTDAIHFGRILPGTQGIRGFVLNNTKDIDVVAELTSEGEISLWVEASDQNVLVKANSARQINLTVTAPNDAEFREYKGTLKVVFRRAEQ